MFIMSAFLKKKIKIIICIALAVCVAVFAFFIGVKTAQDDIVFELKYIDKNLNAEYFALKDDDTLLWQYGEGVNSDYTFGSYFSRGNIFCDDGEKGIVNIPKEEAKELKRKIKGTTKGFQALSSNPIKSKKGGQAIFFKYKNKYYNMEYPKKDGDIGKAKQNMGNLRNACKACVDENRINANVY